MRARLSSWICSALIELTRLSKGGTACEGVVASNLLCIIMDVAKGG
jgi:hypothetical protein